MNRSAVEVVNEHGRSDFVLLCEHASHYIPPEYENLGLAEPDLTRHIAWDIGAANVTRQLATLLDAPAFLSTCSRLLIDLNRPLNAPSSVVVRSEATDIPGNASLDAAEIERRQQLIFKPYHDRIVAHLEERQRSERRTLLVAVHSFTPVYHGKTRPWHAGVLFDQATEFAGKVISNLRSDPLLTVDANVPYGVSPDEDYGLLVYGDYRNNPAILIEIRHDLIRDDAGVGVWASRLAQALRDL